MRRTVIVGSLFAMALVFMGLRVAKRRSLSARGREWPVVTEKELLRAFGVKRGKPHLWPEQVRALEALRAGELPRKPLRWHLL